MAKPLFKWTGGKGRLLQKYKDLNFFPDPSEFDTFVNLFFGAGSVTCWVAEMYPDKNLIINDKNTELVSVYTQMRDNWVEFKGEYLKLAEMFLDTPQDGRKELYNNHRDIYCFEYKQMTPAREAAMLLVMMKVNFNGIWKTYKKFGGRYSTCPGGINYKESVFDIQKLELFRDVLCRATVYNRSFEDVPIPERSWVFADPPYRDTNKAMYSDQFDDDLQSNLAEFLQSHNCLYAESNKEIGDGFWASHFPDAHLHFLDHKYTCSPIGVHNQVTEVLIKNYGETLQEATLEFLF